MGSPPAIRTGDVVLERYRVVEQIAAGGHSVVYRGDDERLSRPVCIKVFSGLGGEFGIAKWSSDPDEQRNKQRAEDTAIVAGQKLAMYSPSWAAPEQLAGQPVSPATDIYSLACVAVYMISTKAVFADEDVYAGYKKRRHAGELVAAALAPCEV